MSKKIYIQALFVAVSIYSFCFIQAPSVKAEEAKTFVGTIESFQPVMGKPPKWYFSKFTAVAGSGEKIDIWTLGLSGANPTTVTDFEGNPVDRPGYNHRPQVGKKAEIHYTTAVNGRNEAISIRYVPADYVPQAEAADDLVPAAPAAPVVQQGNIIIGRIDKVMPVPPGFRTNHNCVLHVVPDNENEYVSVGLKNASLTYFDGKPLPVQDLKIGERVEVKYSCLIRTSLDGIKEYMASSIRYIPPGYTPDKPVSPAAQVEMPATPANTAANNTFVGKIVKGGVTFSLHCPYRFVLATDSGEKKDIWIPRDNMRITDVNGKLIISAPPRAGKRMEIKYAIGDNGQYEAASMRYVPEGYVPQAMQPAVEQNVQQPAVVAAQSGNIFTGRIELVQATMHRQISHPFCKITVVSAEGQKNIFFVPGTTPVFDASGKDIGEGGAKVGALFLRKGQRVQVQYSTITNGNIITNGQLGADTVHILE